ncbi:hypothetical protein BC941DRAFT_426764 [Chlamydoabsidia padenii]|nr:hypothetical protein BC941DRAFT_426764 [Chlamydoabsidia padenii]
MVLYVQRSLSTTLSFISHPYSILRQQQLRRGLTCFRKPCQQHSQQTTSRLALERRDASPSSTCYSRPVKARTSRTRWMPVTLSLTTPSYQLQSKRTFAWWRIPLALMKTGKKQKMMALITAVGGSSLLGFFFGPISFLVVSTVFGGLAWRIWRQTSKWWQYLPNNILNNNNNNSSSIHVNNASLYSMVRSLVGQHRAEDSVRELAIRHIKQWAHTEEGRKALLYDFNVPHTDDLTFLPIHARSTYTAVKSSVDSKTNKENTTKQQEVDIQFLIQTVESGNDGGGCMVDTRAFIDGNTGNISLKDIKLSCPGWSMDKYVPLDDEQNKRKQRVIEGDFRDL